MAEYLITKREKCDHSASTAGALAPCNICCKDGYARWEVPLIDVLKNLRFQAINSTTGERGMEVADKSQSLLFANVRIEDD